MSARRIPEARSVGTSAAFVAGRVLVDEPVFERIVERLDPVVGPMAPQDDGALYDRTDHRSHGKPSPASVIRVELEGEEESLVVVLQRVLNRQGMHARAHRPVGGEPDDPDLERAGRRVDRRGQRELAGGRGLRELTARRREAGRQLGDDGRVLVAGDAQRGVEGDRTAQRQLHYASNGSAASLGRLREAVAAGEAALIASPVLRQRRRRCRIAWTDDFPPPRCSVSATEPVSNGGGRLRILNYKTRH
jgi:hypothetical protein